LVDLIYSEEAQKDPEKYNKMFYFIEQELGRLSKVCRCWVVGLTVDFENEMACEIIWADEKTKPTGISYKNISMFLINAYRTLVESGIFIYKIQLAYNKQPVFVLGEHPNKRQTCIDLKQYAKKNDYFAQLQQTVEATTFI
jgi:hypothetical protein